MYCHPIDSCKPKRGLFARLTFLDYELKLTVWQTLDNNGEQAPRQRLQDGEPVVCWDDLFHQDNLLFSSLALQSTRHNIGVLLMDG